MNQYQEISYFGSHMGMPIHAFDKIDGSNLRFGYNQKRGFYKFGTKNMMIDKSHSEFGFAIDLFLNKYNEGLSKIFKSKDYRNSLSFICYAELIGIKSEFGFHEFNNDIFDIILFDIDEYKKGLIPPKQFIKNFSPIGIPKVVYEGNLNREFINDVKENKFDLKEGVICKGVIPHKKDNNLYMCKIKTNDWFFRLRNRSQDMYDKELKQSEKFTTIETL